MLFPCLMHTSAMSLVLLTYIESIKSAHTSPLNLVHPSLLSTIFENDEKILQKNVKVAYGAILIVRTRTIFQRTANLDKLSHFPNAPHS
jgi:hypothetical protein